MRPLLLLPMPPTPPPGPQLRQLPPLPLSAQVAAVAAAASDAIALPLQAPLSLIDLTGLRRIHPSTHVILMVQIGNTPILCVSGGGGGCDCAALAGAAQLDRFDGTAKGTLPSTPITHRSRLFTFKGSCGSKQG